LSRAKSIRLFLMFCTVLAIASAVLYLQCTRQVVGLI
jgi:CHASE3 domain sensor protein